METNRQVVECDWLRFQALIFHRRNRARENVGRSGATDSDVNKGAIGRFAASLPGISLGKYPLMRSGVAKVGVSWSVFSAASILGQKVFDLKVAGIDTDVA